MLAIEKWSIKRNDFIAICAPQAAALAFSAPETLRNIRDRRVGNHQFPLPDLPTWFTLYRSPLKSLLATLEMLIEFSDSGQDIVTLLCAGRVLYLKANHKSHFLSKIKPSEQGLEEGRKFWRELRKRSLADIEESFSNTPFDPDTKVKFDEYVRAHETALGFCMLVYMPCLLLYKETPVSLYKKALRADVSALKKLLKIDPLLINDSAIGKVMQEIRLKPRITVYEDILNAARTPPNISNDKIKTSLMSLILLFAKLLKMPIKAAELRFLLDDYARDAQGAIEDHDIKSPEGFDKTIKNKTSQWQNLFPFLEKNK